MMEIPFDVLRPERPARKKIWTVEIEALGPCGGPFTKGHVGGYRIRGVIQKRGDRIRVEADLADELSRVGKARVIHGTEKKEVPEWA